MGQATLYFLGISHVYISWYRFEWTLQHIVDSRTTTEYHQTLLIHSIQRKKKRSFVLDLCNFLNHCDGHDDNDVNDDQWPWWWSHLLSVSVVSPPPGSSPVEKDNEAVPEIFRKLYGWLRPGNARGSLRVFSADCDPNESGSDEKRSGSEETPKLQNQIFKTRICTCT